MQSGPAWIVFGRDTYLYTEEKKKTKISKDMFIIYIYDALSEYKIFTWLKNSPN